LIAGTGIITKVELKYFYTAFMDVGKLGEQKVEEITNNAFHALTSVIDHSMKTNVIVQRPVATKTRGVEANLLSPGRENG
jgi:NADPH-dependent 7-cyano-7-deazaguanine reductase QueF